VKKKPQRPRNGVFLKTDVPCLYRYSSTNVYFALLKHEGKQKRITLKTTDKAEAKRNLAEARSAPSRLSTGDHPPILDRRFCRRGARRLDLVE
jgi:hypothetical protein